MRRRGSLWLRVSLLGVAVAVLTGVLAGALAVNLIRSSNNASARRVLSQVADAVASTADHQSAANPNSALGRSCSATAGRLRRTVFGALRVQCGRLTPQGTVESGALVEAALTPADRTRLLAGHAVSATGTALGRTVLVEARPLTGGGAVILVQARSDATAAGNKAIGRTIVAILIGVGTAAVLGVGFALWLARPLRRAAQAARALADGRRDVVVPVTGPAEVAEVADAVNTLASALTQSEARQREFLLSVSHDLRTPLTSITGYAESLADDIVPPERTREVGAVMLGEAKRLGQLVGDLLDLARLDAQDFRLDLTGVDLVELAQGAAAVWTPRCAAVGVEFAIETQPAGAWTDASRLRQALDGLIENALRVTPAGQPIVLAVRIEPDGRACAEVRDGGPGLSEDDLAVAFERSELHRRYQGIRQVGTGLGLAIVHRLITRLGGTIEAGHAQHEGGARFTVRLPASGPDSR